MRNFVTCSAGEQLFGLPVTDYPTLHHYRKELTLLQKLYGLYTAVMQSIDGYYDILWSDIDIEKINAELTEFQNRLFEDFLLFCLLVIQFGDCM